MEVILIIYVTVNTLVGVMIAGEREKSTNQVCFQGKLFHLNMSKTKGVNFRLAVFVTAQQKSLMKERLTKEILIGESIGSVNADIVDIHVAKVCRVFCVRVFCVLLCTQLLALPQEETLASTHRQAFDFLGVNLINAWCAH